MELRERDERERARRSQNQEFFERYKKRRPEAAAKALEKAKRDTPPKSPGDEREATLEAGAEPEAPAHDLMLETIVRRERPVLFVENDWVNKAEVTILGDEAQELVDDLDNHKDRIQPLMPLVGRIDVSNFAGLDYVGTGWLVAEDVIVTNRHVAGLIAHQDGRLFAFTRGVGGRAVEPSFCTAHEFDDLMLDASRMFEVKEVLYIERNSQPHDIAFIRIKRRTDGTKPPFIPIAAADVGPDTKVLVVGYPARASKRVIPDQQLMKELYRDRFDVKRAAPGYTLPSPDSVGRHDCTTLGGNSGSVVLDLATGRAVGLHFAGLYQETNYAVTASILTDYVKRKRWLDAAVIETSDRGAAPGPSTQVASMQTQDSKGQSVTFNLPVTITLSVGTPTLVGGGDAGAPGPAAPGSDPEAAAAAFWAARPDGVVAVRVGYSEERNTIGDRPLIAASVPADRLADVVPKAPTRFQGYEVRYFSADAAELVASIPALESVDEINYDDQARKGAKFSFDPVTNERVEVLAHVGPEYSWDTLKEFLEGGPKKGALVSAIYEFHAKHIADVLEERLNGGASLKLVMDNQTFMDLKGKPRTFERIKRFNAWDKKEFERIVVPEGTAGLISDAYHIKVTVRDDDTFWLSSGNWKPDSSQPIVTQEDRDNADTTDIEGNREWHVVIKNKTLADRFRNHIKQDFVRSEKLGGGRVPKSKESLDIFVDIPIEEFVEERRAPGHVLKPRTITGKFKVQPLLTPDQEGAVFSEAVLELIGSAERSLYFQIPYIGMRPKPRERRGYIDDLIDALTDKLKNLEDAKLLLRSQGSRFSAPTHAAWYFKSKGVDIGERVKQIDDHHTKGMIVDGQRVLLGSHNWSKPGVTLNRDASLIFDSADIAAYYTEAFDIDWERARSVRSKRFVKAEEAIMLEAVGDAPPPGFKRVSLAELRKEED